MQLTTPLIQLGNEIAARHGVPLVRVRSKIKHPATVRARQEFWVTLLDAGFSLSQAGRATGGHHHTTVLHGRRMVLGEPRRGGPRHGGRGGRPAQVRAAA